MSSDGYSSDVSAARFRHVLGHYPTGVCVVTSIGADRVPHGMTVGSFTSASLDPPLIAFLPAKTSTTWPKIAATGRFCVNILADDQLDVCRAFTSREADRFAACTHDRSPMGMPRLAGTVAWIDCMLDAVHEAGDHWIVVGRVIALDVGRAAPPLLFCQRGFGTFGPLRP